MFNFCMYSTTCAYIIAIYMYLYTVHFYRWSAVSGPKKVYDQIDSTEQQLEQNEKKFQKNLQNDQASFEDRLDSLEARLNNEYRPFNLFPSPSSPYRWLSLGSLVILTCLVLKRSLMKSVVLWRTSRNARPLHSSTIRGKDSLDNPSLKYDNNNKYSLLHAVHVHSTSNFNDFYDDNDIVIKLDIIFTKIRHCQYY